MERILANGIHLCLGGAAERLKYCGGGGWGIQTKTRRSKLIFSQIEEIVCFSFLCSIENSEILFAQSSSVMRVSRWLVTGQHT